MLATGTAIPLAAALSFQLTSSFTKKAPLSPSNLQQKAKGSPSSYATQSTMELPRILSVPNVLAMSHANSNMFLASSANVQVNDIPTSSSAPSSQPSSVQFTSDLHLSPLDLIHSRRYRDRGILGFTVDGESAENEVDGQRQQSSSYRSSLRASRSHTGNDINSSRQRRRANDRWDSTLPWEHMGDDYDDHHGELGGDNDSSNLPWESFSSWSSDRPILENGRVASIPRDDRFSTAIRDDRFSADEKVSTSFSSFLPWIPRPAQIQRLTVRELQDALSQRRMSRAGTKTELQQRLLQWSTLEKQKPLKDQEKGYRHAAEGAQALSLTNLYRSYGVDGRSAPRPKDSSPPPKRTVLSPGANDNEGSIQKDFDSLEPGFFDPSEPSLAADSLAEWSRTVDLEPLFRRREAIHREKQQGKPVKNRESRKKRQRSTHDDESVMTKEQYINVLKKVFDESSSTKYSNYEVKQIYAAAKEADKMGDRALSKRILNELKEATPGDGRIYRRLSRMEKEEGNIPGAKSILQEGIRRDPENAFLWHGLGQLSSEYDAKKFYRKAIRCNPSIPMPYHALGTLGHTRGNIAQSMKTLKKGLEYCPTNHRLHHALGDIYRDAKMLSMAEKCYRKALKYGPEVSQGFAYNALAYVAYDEGSPDRCRSWLRKAVSLNSGRHANSWVSWAQMEESEGNIDAARTVSMAGIAKYERGLLRHPSLKLKRAQIRSQSKGEPRTATEVRNQLMKDVPVYRPGDRFFNVYRNWARLEERHGTSQSVDEVYRRACLAFPRQWKLTIDWAQYHARLNMHERASELFLVACSQSLGQHGDPYRLHAEYEMSRGDYEKSQRILFRGAVALSQNVGAGLGGCSGMIQLYYVWAVCEWHLENLSRAKAIFDQALQLIAPGQEGSSDRSLIYFALAKLHKQHDRPLLSQHFIGLCVKENSLPGGAISEVWDLWAQVASLTGNDRLRGECETLAEKCWRQENEPSLKEGGSSRRIKMEHKTRRDPWYIQIFGSADHHMSTSHQTVRLPLDEKEEQLF